LSEQKKRDYLTNRGRKSWLCKPLKNSKAPDGQGPLLTNYKPKL